MDLVYPRPMVRLALLLPLLAALTGCSTLSRGGAAEAAMVPSDEEDEDVTSVPMAEAAPVAPPGQTEVAWEDNGVPIRQLTGPGKPHELKVPESTPQKKATLSPKKPAK